MKKLLSEITPDKEQPRKHFDQESIQKLAHSLKTQGQIHPIEIDSEGVIIIGEQRYQAALVLGWKEIEVSVYQGVLSPYRRLVRQLHENLSRSGNNAMNAIDLARALVRLYELKTNRRYQHDFQKHQSEFAALCKDVGIKRDTGFFHLALLDQPSFVIEDIGKGRSSAYYHEVINKKDITENEKKRIVAKIAHGEYKGHKDVRADVRLFVINKEAGELALLRKQTEESKAVNRLLNAVVSLSASFAIPLQDIPAQEKGIVVKQLQWIQGEIQAYVRKPEVLG